MNRSTLLTIGAIAVVGIGAALYVTQSGGDDAPASQMSQMSQMTAPPPAADVASDELLQAGPLPDMILGDANAPVTVVEYASLTCSHCADFHEDAFPQIKQRLIDTGKVRFIFREFPLDPVATAGFMLARCSAEDKYFAVVDAFFKQQDSLRGTQNPLEWLQNFGKQLGFTGEQVEACLSNQTLMDNLLAVRQRASEKFGVSSTPTFFFNGKIRRGGMSVEEFEKELESHLKS